jgi:hypothetical protein
MGRALICLSLLLSIVTVRAAAVAAEREAVIAVFDIEDRTGRPRELVGALTDYLRARLAVAGRMRVVDKGEQEAQLRRMIESEKEESYRSCYDESCQVPLGKELAADRILRSKLSRIGSRSVLAAEVIDLGSGTVISAATAESDELDDHLMTAVDRLVSQLVGPRAVAALGPRVAESSPRVDLAPRTELTPNATHVRSVAPSVGLTTGETLIVAGAIASALGWFVGIIDEFAAPPNYMPQWDYAGYACGPANQNPNPDPSSCSKPRNDLMPFVPIPIAGPAIVEIASGRYGARGLIESGVQLAGVTAGIVGIVMEAGSGESAEVASAPKAGTTMPAVMLSSRGIMVAGRF